MPQSRMSIPAVSRIKLFRVQAAPFLVAAIAMNSCHAAPTPLDLSRPPPASAVAKFVEIKAALEKDMAPCDLLIGVDQIDRITNADLVGSYDDAKHAAETCTNAELAIGKLKFSAPIDAARAERLNAVLGDCGYAMSVAASLAEQEAKVINGARLPSDISALRSADQTMRTQSDRCNSNIKSVAIAMGFASALPAADGGPPSSNAPAQSGSDPTGTPVTSNPADAATAGAAETAAPAVYACNFGGGRDYLIDTTYGHEKLFVKGRSYPFSIGSGFWSAGDDNDPSIGGAFAIKSDGPDAPSISVNLDSADNTFHGRATCLRQGAKATSGSTGPLQSSVPEDIRRLLSAEADLNEQCRGGSVLPTDVVCRRRDRLVAELQSKGWCYGEGATSGADAEWKRCVGR